MNINRKAKGFTIIEVVLVLAIAGLIFLMVFIALPALQRAQRDTQRKNDLGRIATKIADYQSNNRGVLPTSLILAVGTPARTFVQRYLAGTATVAGAEYLDPSSGTGYTFTGTTGVIANTGTIVYTPSVICGVDGATTAAGATNRTYALRTRLEGGTADAPYCVDNR